jgi:hypothetical protein
LDNRGYWIMRKVILVQIRPDNAWCFVVVETIRSSNIHSSQPSGVAVERRIGASQLWDLEALIT